MRNDPRGTGMNRRQFLNQGAAAAGGTLIAQTPGVLAGPKVPWRADGDGMARIGLLVPSFDFNPESEIWAMAPKGVAIFAARMERGTLPFHDYVSAPSHADAAVAQLTTLKLRAILYAYSTTSFVLGLDGEEAFRARLAAAAGGTPVVLAATALSEGLRLLNVRRVAVVLPPWFSDEGVDKGKAYFLARGFEIVSCARIAPARTFTEVAAEEVHDWIAANTSSKADAVVVGGNGLRAVGAIEALEATLGRPVITANQAMLWQGLRVAGAPAQMDHYGRLFKANADLHRRP